MAIGMRATALIDIGGYHKNMVMAFDLKNCDNDPASKVISKEFYSFLRIQNPSLISVSVADFVVVTIEYRFQFMRGWLEFCHWTDIHF